MTLYLCQSGYESLLSQEVAAARMAASPDPPDDAVDAAPAPEGKRGPGWALIEERGTGPARTGPGPSSLDEPAFPHLILESAVLVTGERVNALAQGLLDFFIGSLRGERIEAGWPCVFGGPAEVVGLGRRVRAVEAEFLALLRKKFGRLAKLALPALPRGLGPARGLFVWFTDFGQAWAARSADRNGPGRMADDPLAPSRSYLKVEEAYGLLGHEPREGETVCDLGAAPGGWSYSAARRGARVIAVDNGPLKGGALDHPRIEHRREDAFCFQPRAGEVFDWLFCDLLEEPHHVLHSLVQPWLARRWCRRFVVNLKFGRVAPLGLLAELRAPSSPLADPSLARGVRIRHLFHDREEFTIAGEGTA